MVWFAENTISVNMMLRQQLNMLRRQAIAFADNVSIESVSSAAIQNHSGGFVEAISPFFLGKFLLITL
jgi:hypothetical protein